VSSVSTPRVRAVARELVERRPPGVWNAVLAVTGDSDEAERLASTAPQIAADDTRPTFAAYGAEVAARRGDARLGEWCSSLLDQLGDTMVTVGLGSVVLNAAPFYAGLGRLATGDVSGAVDTSRTGARPHRVGRGDGCGEITRPSNSPMHSGGPPIRSAHARASALVASVINGPIVARSARLRMRASEVHAALGQ
jgi:hypothetical protein